MSWSSARGLVLLVCALASCSSAHPCAEGERCNGIDDDCDGKSDEDFLDARGRYVKDEHCGTCATDCDAVFPSALETRCETEPAVPACALVSCPPGSHPVGQGACVEDQPVLCLPCTRDDDCSARTPRARCVERDGLRRCAPPCDDDAACPAPFRCVEGACDPAAAPCACEGVEAGFEVACLGEGTASALRCAGLATCGAGGLGTCRIAARESCDGEDDDCDGRVDEDFVNEAGRYVGPLHCGGCGRPCAAPGPGYIARCLEIGNLASCDVACELGFVDVDGIRANGCECQVFTGESAPVVLGGDLDCDGDIDDSDAFVHVSPGGSDAASGTLRAPMRTLRAALARAAAEQKAVVVAQGTYEPFEVVPGVSVFGGYRADFRARDAALYPVVIEGRGRDGAPVLVCRDVLGQATIEGLTLRGADASTPGRGATAARFEGCGAGVRLSDVTVLAGRGADGRAGEDASARLPAGIPSLAALAGSDARPGVDGDDQGLACLTQPGGAGGEKRCGGIDVSGGRGGGAGCAETGCANGLPCANAGCTDFTVAGACDYATVLRLALPNPPAEDGRGPQPGRAGPPTYNAPTNRGTCSFCDDNPTLQRLGQDGADGAPGASGAAGPGCATSAPVVFDAEGRASASAGAAAPNGTPGSGGGGGSGGSGFDVIGGTIGGCDDTGGGSGGGAGSGGCGAPGGGGGGGGGGSLGLLIRLTPAGVGPTLERVRIVTASGGRGGDGGIGAAGGRGGAGALGGQSRYFCARNGGRGGNGGEGGAGGGGGGGCGGPSHAVVVEGTGADTYRAAIPGGLTIEQAGVPGQGGRGGFSPGVGGVEGAPGSADPVR